MAVGYQPISASLVAKRRIAVSVAQPRRSSVQAIYVPGPQGAQGEEGPAGTQTGFGQITYTERTVGPEDVFQAGVRQQLKLAPGMSVQNFLNPPFDTHTFLVDNRIIGRALADFYDITVNLLITAQQEKANIKIDLDVGSPLGPTGAFSQAMQQGAGTQERATFPLSIQVLANMLANGAAIYLTSDVTVTVISEAIVIHPKSIRPSIAP